MRPFFVSHTSPWSHWSYPNKRNSPLKWTKCESTPQLIWAPRAGAFFVQVEAGRFDADVELCRLEPHAIGEKTFAECDAIVLNLKDLIAVGADYVKRCWRLFSIDFVVPMLAVELHFADEMAIQQHRQSPIDRSQRNQAI